jgi:hypothetical protein
MDIPSPMMVSLAEFPTVSGFSTRPLPSALHANAGSSAVFKLPPTINPVGWMAML